MKRACLSLVVFLFLAACGGAAPTGKLVKQYGGEKTRPDKAAQKSIVLTRHKTNERLNLIYYKDGGYEPEALRQIDFLFRDRQTNETAKIDPELIDYLVDIRTRLGLPPTVVFLII